MAVWGSWLTNLARTFFRFFVVVWGRRGIIIVVLRADDDNKDAGGDDEDDDEDDEDDDEGRQEGEKRGWRVVSGNSGWPFFMPLEDAGAGGGDYVWWVLGAVDCQAVSQGRFVTLIPETSCCGFENMIFSCSSC